MLGNHERYSDLYFAYFHLPENGAGAFEEHWWTHDVGNIRIVGLDSNIGPLAPGQTEWVSAALDDACEADDIDFVFAQLHHPHRSELWPPGENLFTADVGVALEDFSSRCSKPSVLFFGHTHGYSRGQARDHRHLMVNVATAGGNIDYWGEYDQIDYEDFTVSQDEWGFVLVEVEAGAAPSMTLTRYSRGNEVQARDNEVRDGVTIRLNGDQPSRPDAIWPRGREIDPCCVIWQASPFVDGDDDIHQATQWQLAESCEGLDEPIVDRWRQRQNWFNDVDTQAGDNLTDEVLRDLGENQTYCWRVRYRDVGLLWSEWSEPAHFTTGPLEVTTPLLRNPGAEEGTEGWTVVEGFLESLTANECGGVSPHGGTRYFSIGGLCESAEYGEANQRIDLSEYAERIDGGGESAELVGWLRNYSGDDEPTLQVVFYDAGGTELGRGALLESRTNAWLAVRDDLAVPESTRVAEVVLTGRRTSGTDNDSYVDDISFRFSSDLDCQEPGPVVDGDGDGDSDGDGDGDSDADSDSDGDGDGDVDGDADAGADGDDEPDSERNGCDCSAGGRSNSTAALLLGVPLAVTRLLRHL